MPIIECTNFLMCSEDTLGLMMYKPVEPGWYLGNNCQLPWLQISLAISNSEKQKGSSLTMKAIQGWRRILKEWPFYLRAKENFY